MEITDDDLDFARDTLGPNATDAEVRNLAEQRADRDAPEIITNRYSTDHTQSGFLHAWRDLRGRLDSADTNLRTLASGKDDDEFVRLHEKRNGVDAAYSTWEHLNDRLLHGDLDPAGAWRTFTDNVTRLFDVADQGDGFYEGVHLALTYQRGYGPGIDAPAMANPHTRET